MSVSTRANCSAQFELPHIETAEAIRRLEAFRQSIEDKAIRFQQSELRVTVSIGATTIGKKIVDSMLAKADALLYEAKTSGRNKLVTD